MKTRNSNEVVRAKGVPAPSSPFYVVECDAYELPEFWYDRAKLIPSVNAYHVANSIQNHGVDKSWYGEHITVGGMGKFDQVRDLLKQGWPEGAEKARKLSEKLLAQLPEPESARRKPIWKDEGDEIDRDRLYNGELDTAWRGTTKVVQRAPRVIKIAANWSMSAMHSAEQIMWRGITHTALLDVLERSGYGTELSIAYPSQHYAENHFKSMPVVRIKTAGDPVDLSNIACIAANAAVLRTFGFCMICSSPWDVGMGLGAPVRITEAWNEAIKAGVVEPVDCYVENAMSEDAALAECKRVLKGLFPEMKWQGKPEPEFADA